MTRPERLAMSSLPIIQVLGADGTGLPLNLIPCVPTISLNALQATEDP